MGQSSCSPTGLCGRHHGAVCVDGDICFNQLTTLEYKSCESAVTSFFGHDAVVLAPPLTVVVDHGPRPEVTGGSPVEPDLATGISVVSPPILSTTLDSGRGRARRQIGGGSEWPSSTYRSCDLGSGLTKMPGGKREPQQPEAKGRSLALLKSPLLVTRNSAQPLVEPEPELVERRQDEEVWSPVAKKSPSASSSLPVGAPIPVSISDVNRGGGNKRAAPVEDRASERPSVDVCAKQPQQQEQLAGPVWSRELHHISSIDCAACENDQERSESGAGSDWGAQDYFQEKVGYHKARDVAGPPHDGGGAKGETGSRRSSPRESQRRQSQTTRSTKGGGRSSKPVGAGLGVNATRADQLFRW